MKSQSFKKAEEYSCLTCKNTKIAIGVKLVCRITDKLVSQHHICKDFNCISHSESRAHSHSHSHSHSQDSDRKESERKGNVK